MKWKRRYFWFLIVFFTLAIAFFFLFIVPKKLLINNNSFSQVREKKKNLNIHILRYEQDLFSLDVHNMDKEIERLSKKYPPLLIEPEIWNDKERMNELKAYLTDTVIISLSKNAEKVIKTNVLLKELEKAFGYYKVFYPNDSIPLIITMISGLDMTMPSVYIYDNILFVNVDMYLGADNSYYRAAGIPLYIAERCNPVYLPIDIFKRALVYKYLQNPPRTTLLEVMITEGKKLYFTQMMFPALHERFIIGYSEKKYDWAKLHLGNIWNYIIEKNELFGKEEALMRSYIEDAPFTKQFGNDSPGRLGSFMGWKLIQSYMKNNPNITLPELMQEFDYQKILNLSKFKPHVK